MSGNDVQIKVSDLTMAYGDFVLLKDASFEVRKQDIFVRRKMDLHNWDSGINRDFGGHIGIRYL